MMRRIPILPTIVVAVAVATMVALGFWQLGRARERDLAGQHQRERAALPTIAYPFEANDIEPFLYRRLTAQCERVMGWQAKAGTSSTGQSGWRHIAECLSTDGKTFLVDVGVGAQPKATIDWEGGPVAGRAIAGNWSGDLVTLDSMLVIVAEQPAGGLSPSRQPAPQTGTNSSWSYTVQWFLFAATALVIYVLALRKRWRGQ